jgi:hypothetical protein
MGKGISEREWVLRRKSLTVGVRMGRILGVLLQALFGFFVALGVVGFASASRLLGYVGAALVRLALLV